MIVLLGTLPLIPNPSPPGEKVAKTDGIRLEIC